MNEIQVFEHPTFGPIRVAAVDGEPWFVAADVCRALEHSNVSRAMERLDDDEKANFKLGLPGGDTNCVNEPGLYSLVLGSRKPEAKAFKRWITHEVLPAIRETGSYSVVSIASTVDQRVLTTDDYLKAAVIVANCRNERLPYVLGFLEKGGWEIPRAQNTPIDRTPIAVIINRTLEETGLTVSALEKMTHTAHAQFYRYKNGQTEPKPKSYDRIAAILNGLTTQNE